MPDRTYHIRSVLEGQTLAAGLRGLIKDLSWADARKLIHARRVQVNGNLGLDETRRLKTGDVVKVFEESRAPVPTGRDVRVVYLDEDLVIVDKPAGITTLRHAEEREWDDQRKQRQPTLDEVVQEMLPAIWGTRTRVPGAHGAGNVSGPLPGPPPEYREREKRAPGVSEFPAGVIRRPGGRRTGPAPSPPASRNVPVPKVRPVHRLDRDTSGLMIFALSPPAEQALVKLFKTHAIRRSYTAVVHGQVREPMRIESWFLRDRGDGLRGSTASGGEEPESQHAVTQVTPIESIADGKYTVVRCELETGRTHQIRIHLAESGHMLCGERTYLRPRPGAPAVLDESKAPRQALHSAELEFVHPFTGAKLQLSAALPRDLSQWRARLEGRRP
jgi:23S rRNA pseudouridine1911/1915/1917 synthase